MEWLLNKRVSAFVPAALSMVHTAAMECNLEQVLFTEEGKPLITKQAYVWESVVITPIHVFARYGCVEALEHYLGLGYDPDMIEKIENYMLKYDMNGELGPDHDIITYNEVTPLMYAVWWNQPEVVELLLENGANPDSQHVRTQWTALMYAAKHNLPDLAEKLLEAGADFDLLSFNFKTAKQIAEIHGNLDVVAVIEEYETP